MSLISSMWTILNFSASYAWCRIGIFCKDRVSHRRKCRRRQKNKASSYSKSWNPRCFKNAKNVKSIGLGWQEIFPSHTCTNLTSKLVNKFRKLVLLLVTFQPIRRISQVLETSALRFWNRILWVCSSRWIRVYHSQGDEVINQHYQKGLVQRFLMDIERNKNAQLPSENLLNAVHYISADWEITKLQTIANCIRRVDCKANRSKIELEK